MPKQRRENRWVARYRGTCGLCGQHIVAGADWISRMAGQNVHFLCMQDALTRRVRGQAQKPPQGREVPECLRGLVR